MENGATPAVLLFRERIILDQQPSDIYKTSKSTYVLGDPKSLQQCI